MSAAWTAISPSYPEYINFREEGDVVVVTMREPARVRDGIYVCGISCRAGGPTCNNYCNRAPQLGPMADRPRPRTYPSPGQTSVVRVPKAEFKRMMGEMK